MCLERVSGDADHTITHITQQAFGVWTFSNDDRETLATTLGLVGPSQVNYLQVIKPAIYKIELLV